MSNFYKWYYDTNYIECYSFKACYQLIGKMKRHGFRIIFSLVIGNTLNISLTKNKTHISIDVPNTFYDQFNHKVITYGEYVRSIERV